MDNPNVHYNEDYRNFVLNHRSSFNSLASALINDGRTEDARKVILHNLEVMPDHAVPFDYTTAQTVNLLFAVDETEKALEIAGILSARSDEFLAYYLDNNISPGNEVQKNLVVLNEMVRIFKSRGEDSLAADLEAKFMRYYGQVNK